MSNKNLLVFVVLVIVVLVGCNPFSSESSGPKPVKNLTVGDLKKSVPDISEENIESVIQDAGEFENELIATSPDDECYALFKSLTITPAEDGYFVVEGANIDLSTCMESEFQGIGTVENASMVISMYMKIKGVDSNGAVVTNDDGKLLDFDGVGGVMYQSSKTRTQMSMTATSLFGEVAIQATITSLMGAAADVNESCVIKDEANGFTGCRSYSLTDGVSTMGGHKQQELVYTELEYKNLEPTKGKYYKNGTIDFKINNWTGTMTYGDDESASPTFTVNNGSVTLQGDYENGSGGFGFKKAIQNNVKREFAKAMRQVKLKL